jgi:XTP/dITP diphosphohydrolase
MKYRFENPYTFIVMNLLFVTHNEHKREEAAKILPNFIALKHLGDIGYTQEIPETRDTLEGNALQKAETVRKTVSMDCFSDDTGLFIHALNGNPGVHSAHYAGPDRNDRHNRSRVLSELENARDRTAYFKTVIALLIDDEALFFEGVIEGKIAHKEARKKDLVTIQYSYRMDMTKHLQKWMRS